MDYEYNDFWYFPNVPWIANLSIFAIYSMSHGFQIWIYSVYFECPIDYEYGYICLL